MPVRLLIATNGQAANTVYVGTDEDQLKGFGRADDQIQLASDYTPGALTTPTARIVTAATATASRAYVTYVFNSASAQTINIVQSGQWPLGTVLTFIQVGAGAFTIVPATGVTINKAAAVTALVSKGQYSVAQMVKTAADTWVAFGGIG